MVDEKWQVVKQLFFAALELPASEREAFVESHCNGDQELTREIISLLECEQLSTGFLEGTSWTCKETVWSFLSRNVPGADG